MVLVVYLSIVLTHNCNTNATSNFCHHLLYLQRRTDDQFILWLFGGSLGLFWTRQGLHQRQWRLQPQLSLHIRPKARFHWMCGESYFLIKCYLEAPAEAVVEKWPSPFKKIQFKSWQCSLQSTPSFDGCITREGNCLNLQKVQTLGGFNMMPTYVDTLPKVIKLSFINILFWAVCVYILLPVYIFMDVICAHLQAIVTRIKDTQQSALAMFLNRLLDSSSCF